MLHNIEIENFQGIKHLKIDKLNQITIIGGRNNTGKTSVLRAIKNSFHFDSESIYNTLSADLEVR